MSKRKTRGRPAGSKTQSVPVNAIAPSSCQQCGSTERSEYFNKREVEAQGEHNGKPYNRVVWRRTRCLNCQQLRDDRTCEFVPEKKAKRAA